MQLKRAKKVKPNGFQQLYHDYDFDQFWDYEVRYPLLIYYAKYSGVLQNVYNEMLYLRFFVFNLAESTQVKWYHNVFVSRLFSL